MVVESPWTPTPDELKSFAGVWHSEEAGASFTLVIENEQAFFVQRPNTRYVLRPQFKDHFSAALGSVFWATRDANGRIVKLHIGASRIRDMPFERE